MSGTDIIRLVISIVACQGAGGIGAIFTAPAITTWYAGLKKPSFTPPNSVFGPVWITLYLLMGIAVRGNNSLCNILGSTGSEYPVVGNLF